MKPSIYHVNFASSQQSYGEGIAVFKDGTVNGGDHGYVYVGTYDLSSTSVSARLKIKKWNAAVTSVFGNIPDFDLDLRGSLSPDQSTFTVTGGIKQLPGPTITIRGRRISDAA
ncbi:MAG: hypothetical protein NVV63_07270 [Opitutus sp.]|nr:hypothetical protein [Opitutus sp.]